MNYAMIEAIAWLIVIAVALIMAIDIIRRADKLCKIKRGEIKTSDITKDSMTKGEIIALFVICPLAFGVVVLHPLIMSNFKSFFGLIPFLVSFIYVIAVCFTASSSKE